MRHGAKFLTLVVIISVCRELPSWPSRAAAAGEGAVAGRRPPYLLKPGARVRRRRAARRLGRARRGPAHRGGRPGGVGHRAGRRRDDRSAGHDADARPDRGALARAAASLQRDAVERSGPARAARAARRARDRESLKATLEAGFTTIRDLGTEGAGYADVGLKQAVNQGIIPGPRMLVVTRAIVATGTYAPKGFSAEWDDSAGRRGSRRRRTLMRVVRDQAGQGRRLDQDVRRLPRRVRTARRCRRSRRTR